MKVMPLDFVKTPRGNIALVVETNNNGNEAMLSYVDKNVYDICGWWNADALQVVNSLPYMLARNMRHPFGVGLVDVENAFRKLTGASERF